MQSLSLFKLLLSLRMTPKSHEPEPAGSGKDQQQEPLSGTNSEIPQEGSEPAEISQDVDTKPEELTVQEAAVNEKLPSTG